MDNDDQKRRKMDVYGFDIEHLIAAESDPKQRVFLIVLNNLNGSLIENTQATASIGQKLDAHLSNFESYTKDKDRLLNQGRGAWLVAAWVLGLAQLAVGASAVWVREEIADLHATDVRIEQTVATIERAQK